MKSALRALVLALTGIYQIVGCDMSTSIQDAKGKHEQELMAMPGVVSVGIGRGPDGEQAIIVGLEEALPDTQENLPKRLEGYPVYTRIIGPIKAQ